MTSNPVLSKFKCKQIVAREPISTWGIANLHVEKENSPRGQAIILRKNQMKLRRNQMKLRKNGMKLRRK